MATYYLFNERTNTFLTDDDGEPVALTETKLLSYQSLFELVHIDYLIFMDADELAIHEYNANVLQHDR